MCRWQTADVRENTGVILEIIHKMEEEGAKVMVFPELALYTAIPAAIYSGRAR